MDLALTKAGRRKVQQMGAGSEPSGRILGLLHEHKALSIDELAELGRMSMGVAKSTANRLHKQALIRRDDGEV